MHPEKKVNVVFVDSTQSYPLRFSAGNTKVEFMAKGLIESGAFVTVINSIFGEKTYSKIVSRKKENINYYIFPQKISPYFAWLINIPAFFKALQKSRLTNAKNFLILDFTYLPFFFLDIFFAKLLGYKVIAISHEYHIAFLHKGLKQFSNYIFDHTFGYFASGILPISEFLAQKAARFRKPMLKVPVLADFSITPVIENKDRTYFLYCGQAGYFRIINKIFKAFYEFVKKGHPQNLILVLSGYSEDIEKVNNLIADFDLCDRIFIKTDLPFEILLTFYNNAMALLIPLEPDSLQDQARFSQKIAEYVSTGRPIITTEIGEIPYFFADKRNAFVTKDFSVESLLLAMEEVLKNKEIANEIGMNGFETGKNEFNYKINGKKIYNYLNEL